MKKNWLIASAIGLFFTTMPIIVAALPLPERLEYGNRAMISLYKGDIPVYEELFDKIKGGPRYVGGSIIGYIHYKDFYIQRMLERPNDTCYQVIIYNHHKSENQYTNGDTLTGYIDRIEQDNGYLEYPWVGKQYYYTDFRGGAELTPIGKAGAFKSSPDDKFYLFELTRATDYFNGDGKKIGTLKRGTQVGIENSKTGVQYPDRISMYAYFDSEKNKWVNPHDTWWLQIDFSKGANVANRNIQ